MKKYLFFLLLSNPVIAMDLESSLKNLQAQLITLENQLSRLGPPPPPRPPSPQPGQQTPPTTPQQEKKTTGFKTSQPIEYRPTIIPPAVKTKTIKWSGLKFKETGEVGIVEKMKSTTPEELAKKQAHALALLKGIDQLVDQQLDKAQQEEHKKEIFDQEQKNAIFARIREMVTIEPLSIYLAYQILKKIGISPTMIYEFIHRTYENLVTQVEENWKQLATEVIVPFGTRVDMDQGLGFADKLEPLLQHPDVSQPFKQFKHNINQLRERLLNLLVDVAPEQREKYEKMGFYVDQYVSMLNPLEQSFCKPTLRVKRSEEQRKEIFNPFAVDLAIMKKLLDRYHNAMRSIKGFILEDIIKKINGFYEYAMNPDLCKTCLDFEHKILTKMKDMLENDQPKNEIIAALHHATKLKGDERYIRELQLKKPVINKRGNVEMEKDQQGREQQKEEFIEESDVVNYEKILNNLSSFLSDINEKLQRDDIRQIVNTQIPQTKEKIAEGCPEARQKE